MPRPVNAARDSLAGGEVLVTMVEPYQMVCSFRLTLSLRGWQAPLLQRDLPLRGRMPLRPPIPVPLPPRT